ncbi:radical SAM protein [Pelomyxa schiedti]|nr:radical SAM protein [Pelomyxa schiedti]
MAAATTATAAAANYAPSTAAPDEYRVEELREVPGRPPTKLVHAAHYHSVCDTATGEVHRWGDSPQDEPTRCPAPEYVEIEISTICHGIEGILCDICYKSYSDVGSVMTYETFVSVFNKLPRTVSQILFTCGDIDANPDLPKMLHYCRNNPYNYVVPNVTLAGTRLNPTIAEKIRKECGAISVSRFPNNKEHCYNSIQTLCAGPEFKQLYINIVFAHEATPLILETINDASEDSRLKGKIVAVLLMLWKPGPRPTPYTRPTQEDYEAIIELAIQKEVVVGYDTDAGRSIFTAVSDIPQIVDSGDIEDISRQLEGCKSMSRNMYINVHGDVMPCPFLERKAPWSESKYNILTCNDFLREIWNSEDALDFHSFIINSSSVEPHRKCKYATTFWS